MADGKGDAPPEDNISCCETPARTGSLSAGDSIPLLACEVNQERIPRSHMQHFCPPYPRRRPSVFTEICPFA